MAPAFLLFFTSSYTAAPNQPQYKIPALDCALHGAREVHTIVQTKVNGGLTLQLQPAFFFCLYERTNE